MIINYLNLRVGSDKVNKLYQGPLQVYGNSDEPEYGWKGLAFTANENNSKISIQRTGNINLVVLSTVEYSFDDGTTWNEWTITDGASSVITLREGQKMCVRSTNTRWANSWSYWTFNIPSGSMAASGNIMSIIDKDNFKTLKTLTEEYTFEHLFDRCTGLTSAPELPATTLANYCYAYMFTNCTSLTTAPELPATTLANYCYYYMFDGCRNMTNTQTILPATTLSRGCYREMYGGCGITKAPILPAETLTNYCYSGIFIGCRKLNEVTIYINDWNTEYAAGWLNDVANSGVIHIFGDAELPIDSVSGCPSGWTVVYDS